MPGRVLPAHPPGSASFHRRGSKGAEWGRHVGALSPHTYPLVRSASVCPVEDGAGIASSRGCVHMAVMVSEAPGVLFLSEGTFQCSEWRCVQAEGSDREPWDGDGGQGKLLGRGGRSFC